MIKMEYKGKAIIGWILISVALGISAFSNYMCSFKCQGVYSKVGNPLTIIGVILYLGGTFLILKGGENGI